MKNTTSYLFAAALSLALFSCTHATTLPYGSEVVVDEQTLLDKIKGGWAGQTIGCTYGGPTEFKYKGAIINDLQPIVWYDDYAYDIFIEDPGLYDDVYMDLTFLEIMNREGIDAPASSYAEAFANADYKLWHANQAARYNILNGIEAPRSGYWENNPHADDIDFQIEADFIGMICPAMTSKVVELCDRVGHIMNYGNGYYGGVYIGTMYSLAFVSDNIPFIVSEALKTIPSGSKLRLCIEDVIRFHAKWPDDWRRCWLEIERRHGFDIGCPEGVFNGFNIDAVINAAYVVMGLLYGDGDFLKTMDVATRCGQDSDCNPASAAGILGVVLGYEAIPDVWKPSIERVEDIDFAYTTISLRTVYGINLRLVGDVVRQQGGKVENGQYHIPLQQPESVAWEESFSSVVPTERRVLKHKITDSDTLHFKGNSVVVMGQVTGLGLHPDENYVAEIEAVVDGTVVETVRMPYDYIKRKYDIFYTYNLPYDGRHTLVLKWLNPSRDFVIEAKEMVVYSAKVQSATDAATN